MTFKNYCYRDIFYDRRSFEKSSTLTLAFFLKLSKPFGTVNQTTFFNQHYKFRCDFYARRPNFFQEKKLGLSMRKLRQSVTETNH